MIKNSCFLVCLLGFNLAFAQQYDATLIAPELLVDANEVVRLEEKVFKATSSKDGSLYYKKAVTILNQKSSANALSVYYDKSSKVSKIKAKLYDGMGKLIRKIDKDEIKDYSAVANSSIYQDDRFKYLAVNHSTYPFTVEFEYEMNLKGMYFITYPDWYIQAYETSVEQGQLVMDLPEDQSFYYQTLNIEITPKIEHKDGRQIYTWLVQNRPAIKKESYGPSFAEVLPIIKTAPDQFEFEGYSGSMRNWEAYGDFVKTLYEGRDELPAEMVNQVKKLTSNTSTDTEKIDILYRFMQENMRYVSVQLGIGGWQPFDANYVTDRKYGDCKALTNFMKAMLKEVGITAYPALIRSGDLYYEVSDTFTTPSFNHVILNIPAENYWLECTSSSMPPNYITSSNENRNVLLITESGGKLIKTPKLSYQDNLEENQVKVTLAEDGSATLSNSIFLKGAQHEAFRYLQHNYSLEEQKKHFIEYADLPSSTIESFAINAATDRPECELNYSLHIPRYGSKAGRRFFIPANMVSAFSNVPSTAEKRNHPIVIKRGYTEKDVIEFEIPSGYDIESIPKEAAQISNDYARYEVKVEKSTNGFTFTRSLEVEAIQLAPTDYDEFRTFFKDVAKLDNMRIVLVKKKT